MSKTQAILNKINHHIVDDMDINRVVSVLREGFLSKPDGGPVVAEFQQLMARSHCQKFAFAVTSGTSALHCAIVALELRHGDEVIVPSLANIADCSVVIQEGGKPIFVDIDPDDFNLDPKKIEAKITRKTRAIIVVHMYGQPAKMDEIKNIAAKYNLVVIEDCAQAAGARYKGKLVGSFGDISCFSFYQTKHIICGEGGMVMTSNSAFAAIITSIANNGIIKDRLDAYDYDRIGFNYQLTEIQAALAIGQFHKLDKNNIERRKHAEQFKSLLSDIDIRFQGTHADTEHSYFYLTALLPEALSDQRDAFIDYVKKLDAPIKKLYPLALTELTLLKDKANNNCPVSEHMTKRIFNLHVNPGLDDNDVAHMASSVHEAFQKIL